MQILLLLVLAIATLGNCKKHHPKSEGYIIRKNGQKKDASHLKIKKTHGKLKVNLTAHEKPKGHGADYDDIAESLDTWQKKDKWLMDMWNKAWDQLKAEVQSEQAKPRLEAEVERNSEEAKWMREWDLFVNAILGSTSTNEAEKAENHVKDKMKIKRKVQDQVLNQARFFIRPEHRRRGLKWVQSTEETDQIYLTYKIEADVEESVYRNVMNWEQIESCNETFRCFMTTQAASTTQATPLHIQSHATAFSKITPSEKIKPRSSAFNNPRFKFVMTSFKRNFLRHQLGKLHKPSKRKASALHTEQGGVPLDDGIVCDPDDR